MSPHRALTTFIAVCLSFPFNGWPESRLTLHPDPPEFAVASVPPINLGDLGFDKKETEQDITYQNTLDRRTKMLKIHQYLGIATGVAMAFTLSSASDSVGKRGPEGKSARDRHAFLGITTGALYFTTASFAMFTPKIPNQKISGRTKIHVGLAFIHFPAMIATMYYGITDKHKLDQGENPSGHKSTAANIAALAFYSSLIVMVIPFGGNK